MCNGKHISIESITRQTQPAREAFLQIVPNATESRLGAVHILRLGIPDKMLSDFGAPRQDSSQVFSKNSVRTSGNEHNRLTRSKMSSG
ncbi:hypothetical protein XH80_09675 [Bradyrhizobium sp. CCBAU 45384]|nr:hypothetical protein [Bradyrhizobium sp. CCBAU 45384]